MNFVTHFQDETIQRMIIFVCKFKQYILHQLKQHILYKICIAKARSNLLIIFFLIQLKTHYRKQLTLSIFEGFKKVVDNCIFYLDIENPEWIKLFSATKGNIYNIIHGSRHISKLKLQTTQFKHFGQLQKGADNCTFLFTC